MNVRQRNSLIITALATAAFVLSIRFQVLPAVIASFLVLLIMIFLRRGSAAIWGLFTGIVLLYPVPQMGWLYGRDSHRAALGVVQILREGWPTSGIAFTATPLLHMHAALSSVVTDIAVFPETTPKILITAILPIVYLTVSVAMIYLAIRRVVVPIDIAFLPTLLLLPVLFWIPLVRFHSAFRRQSIAIVFFAAVVYLVSTKKFSHRNVMLIFLFVASTVLAHHFSSFMLLLYLGVGGIIMLISHRGPQTRRFGILVLFSGIFFSFWFIIAGYGSAYLIGVIASLGVSLDPNLPHEIGYHPIVVYRGFVGLWLYQAVLAVGLFIGYFTVGQIKWSSIQAIIYGGIVFVLSLGAWLGAPLAFNRVMSFFVLAFGWLSPIGATNYKSDRIFNVGTFFIIFIVLIGLSIVPPHLISSQPPDHQIGQYDQRFDSLIYPAAEFAKNYADDKEYIGSLNVWGIVTSMTGQRVSSRPRAISTGQIPDNHIAFIQDRNKHLYATKAGKMNPPNLLTKLDRKNNRIYTNPNITLYSSS
jgi:uncharacterized membrane protein